MQWRVGKGIAVKCIAFYCSTVNSAAHQIAMHWHLHSHLQGSIHSSVKEVIKYLILIVIILLYILYSALDPPTKKNQIWTPSIAKNIQNEILKNAKV